MKKNITVFIVLISCLIPSLAFSAEKQHVYSSWETMEMDKIASLWLIKRFVDPKASFRFYPKSAMNMEGIQIDTPLSEFRRTQNLTTYESLLRAHKLTEASLLYIGQLVRDIEINIWGKKAIPESQGLDLIVKGVIAESNGNPQKCLERGFVVMDSLYKALEIRK